VDEITGFAQTMRAAAVSIRPKAQPLIDTCGTGGDMSGTFNISTAAAFVVCAAGLAVAKHGNRSVSSKSGSADVLEALGVRIDLPPEAVRRCIDEVGIGFMFAPRFHMAMKHAAGPRRELGMRTVFNILGPLTNPAGASRQLLGVFSEKLTRLMAEVLLKLGTKRAMVVHGADGLDEITISGKTKVSEIMADGSIRDYTVSPEQFGIKRAPIEAIQGGGSEENADIIKAVLRGEKSPAGDIVAVNAGAAIYLCDGAPTLEDGVAQAQRILAHGGALRKLEAFAAYTQEAAEEA